MTCNKQLINYMFYRKFIFPASLESPEQTKKSKQILICICSQLKKKSFKQQRNEYSAGKSHFYQHSKKLLTFISCEMPCKTSLIYKLSQSQGRIPVLRVAYEWYQQGQREDPQALHRRHSELSRNESLQNTFANMAVYSHLCDKERLLGSQSPLSANDIIQSVRTERKIGLAIQKYQWKCH